VQKIIKYNDRHIILKPYNTVTERDILLYTAGDYDFESLMEILKPYITMKGPVTYENLSHVEKLNILLELRNGSVGEAFPFIKKCSKCEKSYETEVQFTDVIKEGNLRDFKGFKLHEAFSTDYNDYVDFDIDELDVDIYDELTKYIDDNKTKFNFIASTKCDYCRHTNYIEITEKQLIENLSEDTLAGFYQSITNLVYHGKFSKLDIDSMLPFERSLYITLVNEEIKKSKPKQQEMF